MNASARFTWADFGWWIQPDSGLKKLLSWNAETHELAFWPLLNREPTVVLAVIDTEDEVVRRLEGWQEHTDTEGGLEWLAQRLGGCQ